MQKPDRTLADWLHWLETLHPKSIDLGLERAKSVAATLGLFDWFNQPHSEASNKALKRPQVITVAGTNGKGSTIAALSAMLQKMPGESARSKPTYAAYTSPHLSDFNERIRIDGYSCSDTKIAAAFDAVDAARQQTTITDNDGTPTLSYFEFTTLAALWLFRQARVDICLLEVGLGGRLDAVNIVSPDVAIVTQIGLDHQEYLGGTRELIAVEKLGIARKNVPLLIADKNPPLNMEALIFSSGANVEYIGDEDLAEPLEGKGSPMLHPAAWWAAKRALSLLGYHLPSSLLDQLRQSTRLLGRLSCFDYKRRKLVIDVAHNAEAAARLASYMIRDLGSCDHDARVIAIVGVMRDKDHAALFMPLVDLVDSWVVSDLANVPRATTAAELADVLETLLAHRKADSECITQSGNMQSALKSAVQMSRANDRILVFGSFYTVAELLAIDGVGEIANING